MIYFESFFNNGNSQIYYLNGISRFVWYLYINRAMTEHDVQAQINKIELHQFPEELEAKLKNAILNYGIDVGYGLFRDENRYWKKIVTVCDRKQMEKHVLDVIA